MEFNKEEYLRKYVAGMRAMSKEEMAEYALKQATGMMQSKPDYSGAQNLNMLGDLSGDYLAELEPVEPRGFIYKLRKWLNRMLARSPQANR